MIRLENIRIAYGLKEVLKGISVNAEPGELIALVGPNGSGKSTLLKTICGLLPAQKSAEIWIGERKLDELSLKDRAKAIAYLPQEREAQDTMVVKDILALGRAPYRGRLGQISQTGRKAIERAISQTKIRSLIDRRFGNLSGGEQARVLLARALAVDAPILLVDEPIAALDPYYQISMMEILNHEAKAGKLVITALHDLALAHQFAHRIWIMNQGQIFADGPPETTLSAETLETVFRINMSDRFFAKQTII